MAKKGQPSGSRMRAKYAKYRNLMKKRAMMARKKGQAPQSAPMVDSEGNQLETDDLVDFSEERYDDDRGSLNISLIEQWSDDDEWDDDWDEDEEEEENLKEEPEEESDEEILDFLKKRFTGGPQKMS